MHWASIRAVCLSNFCLSWLALALLRHISVAADVDSPYATPYVMLHCYAGRPSSSGRAGAESTNPQSIAAANQYGHSR
jgi:hypothetical protein